MSHNTLSPSAIDFLTNCSTGVDLIPGFASVHYWVFTPEALSDSSKASEPKSLENALFEAEIALRDNKSLVYHDEQRDALWYFTGASATPTGPPPAPNLNAGDTAIEKYGWTFKIIFTGMIRAAELAMFPNRLAALQSPGTPLSAGAQPPTPGGITSAAANARAFQQNTAGVGPLNLNGQVGLPYDRGDLRAIYGFFIKGVQASFAYTLAKEHKALQLDARTFVVCPEPASIALSDEEVDTALAVFTIDHSLANGGGMLVSTNVVEKTELYIYGEFHKRHNQTSHVIIAPGGAKVEVVLDSGRQDYAQVDQWKKLVREQLRGRGVDLSILDPTDRWILLKTADDKVFYWPQILAFACSPPIDSNPEDEDMDSAQPLLHNSSGLAWFLPPDEGGNKEPIRFAQEWHDGKAARDQIIQDRQKQADLERKQLEAASLNVSSPAFPREGLQATAGVYPTPPDGIPHASQGTGAHDSQLLTVPPQQDGHRSSLDMQHSDMMDLDSIGPFEDNVRQRPGVMSRNSLDESAKLGGDDLFGDDMEDEDLRGQDITDADFSFFDEPEDEDALMLDTIDEEVDGIDVRDTAAEAQKPPTQDSAAQSPLTKRPSTADDVTDKDGIVQAQTNGSVSKPRTQDEDDEAMDEADGQSAFNAVQEPLSPSAVRKKLFDFAVQRGDKARRSSQFQPMAFNASMTENDAKYSLNGAFAFQMHTSQATEGRSPTSPFIKPRPPDQPLRRSSLHPGRLLTSPDQGRIVEEDSSSDVSDTSDDESAYGNGARSTISSSTRARLNDGNIGDDVQSMAGTALLALEEFNISPMDQAQVLSDVLLPKQSQVKSRRLLGDSPRADIVDEPSTRLASRLLPSLLQAAGPLNPQHKDFINVAQLIAEQLATGFVNTAHSTSGQSVCLECEQTSSNPARLKAIAATVRTFSSEMSQCDLLKWLCVQEPIPERPNVPKGHPLAPQKKTTIPGLQAADGTPVLTTALAPLSPPHVRVRRNEGLWDVLPPALPFWEQLGLAPAAGKKNVMAFCMYPGSEDLASQVSIFMDYLGATFESCKLGAHVRATQLGELTMGLVPVKLPPEQTMQSAMQAVREACVELGKQLAGIDWNSKLEFSPAIEDLNKIDNFVIYMINPFDDEPRGLMELCASFWELYEAYCMSITSPMQRASRPDIALQVLPLRYVASIQAPVVMDAPFFQKFAREVYDRCPPATPDSSSSRLPIESGAAVQLEQPLPRKIDFKLQADPPTDLLHEGSNLHLGYSRSKDGEWVSVAWTDTTGKYQASSNYCLVGSRSFAEVARVIWQSTIEIMQARRVAWRLCIARVGVLEKEELDAWSMLATSASSVVMITVVMSVDPTPPVAVYHDAQTTIASKLAGQGGTATPVGTPGPGVSPESVLTPAATPAADTGPDVSNDPDAHLVDIGDETWGLILGHRTNISMSIVDYRPSLSTGFLLKSNAAGFTSLDDPDEANLKGLILVGVKLVWIGSSPKPQQPQSQNQNQNQNQAQNQMQTQSASQPTPQTQTSHTPIQTPFSLSQGSPVDMASSAGLGTMPPTPTAPVTTNANAPPGAQPPQPGPLNTSTSGSSIPKVTADSILRDYLQMYRNLGVLARARGLRGTKRGALPWHVVVAMRAVEGLEASYGTMQTNS